MRRGADADKHVLVSLHVLQIHLWRKRRLKCFSSAEKLFEKRQIGKAWYYLWLDKNKTEYENRSLIDNIFKEINAYEKDVRLIHIPGHKKIFGNEKADLLAKNAAMKE